MMQVPAMSQTVQVWLWRSLLVVSVVLAMLTGSVILSTLLGGKCATLYDVNPGVTHNSEQLSSALSHFVDNKPVKELTDTSVAVEDGGTCGRRSTIPFVHKVCEIESSISFYSPHVKPLVVAKDISLVRYYAQRDLQGWTLAYRNMSFEVTEQSFRMPVKLADLSVFLCMGIHAQDKHCIKPSSYRTLMQGQRINQIHGLRDILWRKDAFCYTLREALSSYNGRKNFTFPCWVLPKDKESLMEEMNQKDKDWIVKPSAKGEGHGIFVVSSFKELDTQPIATDGYVVQPLLSNPYLINGRKIDFRTYVLVTSVAPLRAYIYKEGLVRFASSKYDQNATKARKEQQLLTNTSVGKKYTQLSNLTWTFQRLKQHFISVGVDADHIFDSLNDAIVRTLLASEYRFLKEMQLYLGGYDCQQCFQLLGVDVILDAHLNPIVIEVNGLPSMQLSHDLGVLPNPSSPYTATKFGLMHDLLQILFKRTSVAEKLSQDLQLLRVGVKPGPFCNSVDHSFCLDYKELQKLIDSKREFVNRGDYERIYPSPSGEKYSKLISHMHNLIQRRFDSPVRTLWQTHHLYTALEKLYT